MLIGLSQRVLLYKNQAYDALEHGWYSYLGNHTLVPIANRKNQDIINLANLLDMFIITGGDDSTIRRFTEIKLATQMMARGKPVIGICHGAFLLTDILGGTVVDVEDHADVLHQINYFGELVTVNSHHTMGIKTPHTQAVVLANDDAGFCESWIDGKLAGIVWHPERMDNPWIPEEIQQLFDK